jgi:polysaccharide export outer membrane protein
MVQMNLLQKLAGCVALAMALFLMTGCETTNPDAFGGGGNIQPPPPASSSSVLDVGDLVIVTFSGVEQPPPQHEERIKDDGTITLPLIGSVVAKGKTTGELQQEIRGKYVPKYFTESLNVTVKSTDRYFFVGGEVKGASRYPWSDGMTLVKAIQTAGGFTDFAKRSKVRVTRLNGKTLIVNYDKALEKPELDVPIYPGDTITVPRKMVW